MAGLRQHARGGMPRIGNGGIREVSSPFPSLSRPGTSYSTTPDVPGPGLVEVLAAGGDRVARPGTIAMTLTSGLNVAPFGANGQTALLKNDGLRSFPNWER